MVAVIVSIVSSIVSGMVLFFLQRYFKKKQHEDELREEKRHKRDVIVMKSISAIGEYVAYKSIQDTKIVLLSSQLRRRIPSVFRTAPAHVEMKIKRIARISVAITNDFMASGTAQADSNRQTCIEIR